MSTQIVQEIIQRVFPEGVVKSQSDGFEVSGLPAGTTPQNCEILVRGHLRQYKGDRSKHYLVRTEGILLFLRIRKADPAAWYYEEAVVHTPAVTAQEQKDIERLARETIGSFSAVD